MREVPGDDLEDASLKHNDPLGADNRNIAEHLTAFQYAVMLGREEMVGLLLAHEARKCPTRGPHYIFARHMHLAAVFGRHAIMAQLLKDPTWLACTESAPWYYSLCEAAFGGHDETAKVLLADYNNMQARDHPPFYFRGYRDPFDEGVIMAAVQGRREETLCILLDFLDDLPHFRVSSEELLYCALETAFTYVDYHEGCVRVLVERRNGLKRIDCSTKGVKPTLDLCLGQCEDHRISLCELPM